MTAAAFDDLLTLREIAVRVGSYPRAWRLAAAGKLGEPTIKGCTHFYSREKVDAAAAPQRKAS